MASPIPGAASRRHKHRLAAGLAAWLTMLGVPVGHALAGDVSAAAQPAALTQAPSGGVDFDREAASVEVKELARWIGKSADNRGLPYLIVDKVNARVFVFDAGGHLRGADAALLGMARGDGTQAGVGERQLSAISPGIRTTPAGRFIASLQHDLHGNEILLIDYAASIALHPVVKGKPSERRAERLQSATSADNRISYGCINVPVAFYATVVSPSFRHSNGIVYILPESSQASALFGM